MASMRAVAIAMVAGGLAALLPQAGTAAVKECRNAQSSGIVRAPSEIAGKRLALARWAEKARAFGGTYTNWSLASHKMVKCVRARSGGYECIAVGAPCVIRQVPPRRRPGTRAPIET